MYVECTSNVHTKFTITSTVIEAADNHAHCSDADHCAYVLALTNLCAHEETLAKLVRIVVVHVKSPGKSPSFRYALGGVAPGGVGTAGGTTESAWPVAREYSWEEIVNRGSEGKRGGGRELTLAIASQHLEHPNEHLPLPDSQRATHPSSPANHARQLSSPSRRQPKRRPPGRHHLPVLPTLRRSIPYSPLLRSHFHHQLKLEPELAARASADS